ncbi:MAG: hypothetical protein LBB77_06115 [Treponema sp.]|jgi:hypothetical protein|nr:hypothetical protein [Treponema sp.]
MKRITVLTLGLLSLGLCLYAQEGPQQNNRRYRGFGEYQEISVEKLILSGTLGLSQGVIVLKNGEEIWYAPGLRPYIGFIDGLKEGAAVTLEGWGRKTPEAGEAAGFLRVSKLTLDGKDYEVGPAESRVAQGHRGEFKSPGHRERLGPPEFRGRDRIRPMMEPGCGPRRLPEIRRYYRFRSEPEES